MPLRLFPRLRFVLPLILLGGVFTVTYGQSGDTIAYQGFLTGADGVPLTDDALQLQFSLFDQLAGGTLLWTEVHGSVAVNEGVFAVQLGEFASLEGVPFGDPLFLEVAVGDPSNQEVLSPRTPLTAVPYSLRAKTIDDGALAAGDNVTIERDGDALRISATGGGEAVVPSSLAAPDGSPAEALVVDNDGRVGVGTTVGTTLTPLHVRRDAIGMPVTVFQQPGIAIEAEDATVGLYSGPGGASGSALVLGEIDQNRLVDKWSLLRETTAGNGQSRLRFTFGTDRNYAANNTKLALTPDGRLGLNISNPQGLMHLVSAGDADLVLEADVNNTQEDQNPTLRFRQDGNRTRAFIGLEGPAGTRAPGTRSNAFLVGSLDDDPALQFITNGQVRMTIDPNGTITTAPRNKTMIITGIDFVPRKDGYKFLSSPSLLAPLTRFPNPQIDQIWFAPVRLPQGAVVTRAVGHWFDNRSPELMTLRLERRRPGASDSETLATLDSVGSNGEGSRTDNTIQNATIDNENFIYFIRAEFPRGSDHFSLFLRYVTIEYTTTGL